MSLRWSDYLVAAVGLLLIAWPAVRRRRLGRKAVTDEAQPMDEWLSVVDEPTEIMARAPVDPHAGGRHPWLEPATRHDAGLSPERLRWRYGVLISMAPDQEHIP